jgi:hypothetical protein
MALIKKSSVEETVAAADMVEIVGARTPLRRVGSRWTGRCPFHEERTPSFSVNPVEKLFYCFGCSKGGDVITFVRETEGLDFAGAVEWLADRSRITLEYEETSPRAGGGSDCSPSLSRRRPSTHGTCGIPRPASPCVPTSWNGGFPRRPAGSSGSVSRREERFSPRRRGRRATRKRNWPPQG